MLEDTSILITYKHDSGARARNLATVVNHLLKTTESPIYLYHMGPAPLRDFKDQQLVNYFFEEEENSLLANPLFHRTRYINKLLEKVKTEVTLVLDADVILTRSNVVEAESLIKKGIYDVVYPYSLGLNQIPVPENVVSHSLAPLACDPTLIGKQYLEVFWDTMHNEMSGLGEYERCLYGHAFCINTRAYRKVKGENELFLPGMPEDRERYYRFRQRGLRVTHLNSSYVVHLNHPTSSSNVSSAHQLSEAEPGFLSFLNTTHNPSLQEL
jgi:hypothetical protein|tara:strand:+ start:18372 stop:19178 length:807 start_codon:yes stop_codon:yes gene_type:complete